MGDVVELNVVTTLDLDPARMLANVSKNNFQRVIVIGVLEDGSEFVSASAADGGTFLWDIERAKLKLLRQADD